MQRATGEDAIMPAAEKRHGPTPAAQVRAEAERFGPSAPHRPAGVPPGWAYNPSAWGQRLPIAVLATGGFAAAAGLAAYQLGHLSTVWEPFFGDGSRRILTGRVSQAFPISDAALGAAGYVADAVFGLVGGTARWRTSPWVVVVFAIAVIPFGLVSMTLFIIQPSLYHSWCTLCLVSVAVSLAMVPYAWDEFVASWFWMLGRRDAGVSWIAAALGR